MNAVWEAKLACHLDDEILFDLQTSVEFCGGTHLLRSGDMGTFVISAEEAIAKGIRRVIALTGPEADKAVKKAQMLEDKLAKVAVTVGKADLPQKDLVKLITELGDDISESQISYWRKDEMRNKLKALKKAVDDRDKAKKAAVMTEIVETAKSLCNANKTVREKDTPSFFFELDFYNLYILFFRRLSWFTS